MRTINLKGITTSLSENEMKYVKGGNPLSLEIANPDLLADDGGDDGFGANPLSPKQEACKSPKKDGDPCSFVDDRGRTQYGKCVTIYGRPRHCSDLN